MGAFDLRKCVRPNILKLEPYRCARDDYKDDGTNVLLDANENAIGPSLLLPTEPSTPASSLPLDLNTLNRYPDPHQIALKQLFCDFRNVAASLAHSSTRLTPANLSLGVGSDETIDAILRTFCAPGRDKILTCPPTYGMYSVSACINDVVIVPVPLDASDFQLSEDAIIDALAADPTIKAVYITSPGNPTGESVRKADVEKLLRHPTWNGVVVVDEAYVDFADDATEAAGGKASSLATWVPEWPNLIVMQTLSKGFGLAGVRVGVAWADAAVARILNSLKAPYNLSSPSSALAMRALQPESLAVMRAYKERILAQRRRLVEELPKIDGVGKIRGGKDANFLLVEMMEPGTEEPSNEIALAVYERLAENRNVIVRFRGKEAGCLGCLRITVGTEHEAAKLLSDLTVVLKEIKADKEAYGMKQANGAKEESDQIQASKIVA